MREFNSTKLQRDAKAVLTAAEGGPVVIRRQAKKDFILLTLEEYEKLVGK